MTFFEDIKSKHLTNYVLVTIGDPVIHRISTQKITFDEHYYKPILLNIPSVSESLDIENRKYKISSVRLSISDYKEDGVRFSDSLNTLMNKEVNIYYATSSSKALTYFGDLINTTKQEADVYLAGTFIIRSFTQDEDKVGLNCEDLSQDKLHKDLPLSSIDYNDKTIPIPIIFGDVDRSPCVFDYDKWIFETEPIASSSEVQSSIGSHDLSGSSIYVRIDKDYVNLRLDSQEQGGFDSTSLFEFDIGGQLGAGATEIIPNEVSPLGSDVGLSNLLRKVKATRMATYTVEGGIFGNDWIEIEDDQGNNLTSALTTGTVFPPTEFFDETENTYLRMHGSLHDNDATHAIMVIYIEGTEVNIPCRTYLVISAYNTGQSAYRIEASFDKCVREEVSNEIPLTDRDNWNQGELTEFERTEDFDGNPYWDKPNKYKQMFWGIPPHYDEGVGSNQQFAVNIYLHQLWVLHILEIPNMRSRELYIDAVGRGNTACQVSDVYNEILNVELTENEFADQTGVVGNPIEGQYAFTVDKKINSKKLLEEISASSGLFPYFKNGDFNVKSIKTTYDGINLIINADDVISYKYDRTEIEKVYKQVLVKYHYDYGLKDFTKETDFIEAEVSLSGWSSSYFGDNFDQELVFESKYIRDKTTAENLAQYLCGLHANQHNLISVKLPLNYLDLELGDIVKFDKLIQDRKIFSEDYTISNYDRNGQNIYNLFFITQIKKNLEFVEVKLYQLHLIPISLDVGVDPIYGCTDFAAQNYDPEATLDDNTCEYDAIVYGCVSDQNALNYNPNATNDDGTCVIVTDLAEPIITTINGNAVTGDTITIESEEVISEIITSPASIEITSEINFQSGDQWNILFLDPNAPVTSAINDSDWGGGSSVTLSGGDETLVASTTSVTLGDNHNDYTNNKISLTMTGLPYIYQGDIMHFRFKIRKILGSVDKMTLKAHNMFITTEIDISGYDEVSVNIDYSATSTLYGYVILSLTPSVGTSSEGMFVFEIDDVVFEVNGGGNIITDPPRNSHFNNNTAGGEPSYLTLTEGVITENSTDIGNDNYETILIEEESAFAFFFSWSDLNYLAINNFLIQKGDGTPSAITASEYTSAEENSTTELVDPTVSVEWELSSSIDPATNLIPNLLDQDGNPLQPTGWYKVRLSNIVEAQEGTEVTGIVFGYSSQFGGVYVGEITPPEDFDEPELAIGGTIYFENIGATYIIPGCYIHREAWIVTYNEDYQPTIQGTTARITLNNGNDGTLEQYYESEDLYSNLTLHDFNLGDLGVPQGVELILQVFAFCDAQYPDGSDQYIFTSRQGGIPYSFNNVSIMWAINAEPSSTVNNNDLDNTTIDAIANAVDNPDADAGLLIDSIVDEE